MPSKLPRENHAPNGDRVQAMIPGEIVVFEIPAGLWWDTSLMASDPSWVQVDVNGDGLHLVAYEALEGGLDVTNPAVVPGYPLRNGGVYTFGIPNRDWDDATPGIQENQLVFVNRGASPVTISILGAGA